MTDDLDAPLGLPAQGQDPSAARTRRWPLPPLMPVAAGIVCALAAGLVGAVALIHNPLGGEPRAVSAIASAPPRTGEPVREVAAATPDPQPRDEGPTINIINGMSGQAQAVRVAPPASAEPSSGLDPRLSERGPQGPLPRIAADGRRPSEAYARAFRTPAGSATDMPRVAILIGGLGISQNGTGEAIAKLPGAVTLAFAPYGSDLERVVARARGEGHEVYLQVPMEPFDFPENDPGPQTLLTTLSTDRNMERLHWAMGRFQGYAGLVTYMGGKFTATEAAITPVLREAAKRGLLFVDDGSSARSLVPQVASVLRQPSLRAEIVIDRVPTPAEVDAQLARLEARAREHGFAMGMGSALPVTVERVARWARALEARGILLVPVSAGVPRGQAG